MKSLEIYKCVHGKKESNIIWKILIGDGKSYTRVYGEKCCAFAGTLVHSFPLHEGRKDEIEQLVGELQKVLQEFEVNV